MAALMDSKNIAIMGFTGTINKSLVVRHLHEVCAKLSDNSDLDDTTVHVFTRDHSSTSPPSSGARNIDIHFYPGYSLTDIAGNDEKKENTEKLLALFKALRITRVFLCLPQSLSSTEMITTSNAFTDKILSPCGTVKTVVRISSYGLDADAPAQGPLALAHKAGEEYMRSKGFIVTSIRPTSFFSNFLKYDVTSILECSAFSSPLGHVATVNWIDNEDIAEVAAHCLLDVKLDGRILEITGPDCNCMSAEKMRMTISDAIGKDILYSEIPLPDFSDDYKNLWVYLRNDGFNAVTNTLKEILGREGHQFKDMPIFSTLASHSQLETRLADLTSQLKEQEDELILATERITEENECLRDELKTLLDGKHDTPVVDEGV